MSFLKNTAKNLMKSALAPPAPQRQQARNEMSWGEAVQHHRGDFAFFYRKTDGDAWQIAVPASLLHPENVKENKRRKSARVLEIEDIFDAEELADRKQEIKDDYPREDYDTEAEWKEDIKAEMESLEYEIKWKDMMIIVPVKKADGEKLAMAVREKDATSIGSQPLAQGQECFAFSVFAQI